MIQSGKSKQTMNKAIFLDRDGVLIKTNVIGGKPFAIRSILEFELTNDVLNQLNKLKKLNFLLIVVTNQPDIKKKLISIKVLNLINNKLIKLLPVDSIKVCMELENEKSGNYKPEPGMLLEAAKEFNIDLKKSYMIGDRWRDIGAGHNAGCKTILIDYHYSEELIYKPDYKVLSLNKAVEIITKNLNF